MKQLLGKLAAWRGIAMLLLLLLVGTFGVKAADPVKNDSNYYEITSAEDLKWFTEQVKSGKTTLCGVMTSDIDLSSLGEKWWTPIGYYDASEGIFSGFKGKFDGQNHTVRGLVIRPDEISGLFGYIDGGEVKNIIVDGATLCTDTTLNGTTGIMGFGVIAGGAVNGGRITNCSATNIAINLIDNPYKRNLNFVGGIVGMMTGESRVSRCTMSGIVMNNSKYVGGIVGGMEASRIDSCQVTDHSYGASKIHGTDFVGGIVGMVQNRETDAAVQNCSVAESTKITSDDKKGTLGGGEYFSDEPLQVDGTYEIYTPAQLKGFAALVNSGNTSINGKLMRDLDMSAEGIFTTIGSSDNIYKGTFDGQDHTIMSLTIGAHKYAGLFSYTSGATIKNLTLDSAYMSTYGDNFLGMIVGFATDASTINNCHVKYGQLLRRSGDGEPSQVGGIAGKADLGSTVSNCSFKGIIQAHEDEVGGIVGELNSGAIIKNCYLQDSSVVWGNNKVGGIVGAIIDDKTTVTDCYTSKNGVTIHAETGNVWGNIWGENTSKVEGTHTKYVEDGLIYELTGKSVSVATGTANETKVTGRSDNTRTSFTVINDIGSSDKYITSTIENLQGVEELDFTDNNSNLAWKDACDWLNISIADSAFSSSFKSLNMRYKMVSGTNHIVMLRPKDVHPAGSKMFAFCPDAKVYVDAEYYREFCSDTVYGWGQYKSHLVPTTALRGSYEIQEYGVNYIYDRNSDAKGTITTSLANNGSTKLSNVHVVGADNDKINSNGGTLTIYNDVGETYAYKTTKIWANSFMGNSAIKQVNFEDIMSDASTSFSSVSIAIGDSAFASCANLEKFNLVLSSNDEYDHYDPIHPSQMPIGKGVFAGSEKVKIYLPKAMIAEFRADTVYGWAQYRDLFEAAEFDYAEFTDDGVKYAYYLSEGGAVRYTNKNQSEMEAIVTPWMSEYRNFTTNSVLCPDNSSTIYYLKAIGLDNEKISDNGGTFTIVNDIGNVTNYKTIALSSTGFRNNESIKTITFADNPTNNGNAKASLSLVIPDSTFKDCKNLKELSMYQYTYRGTNHYEAISPSQIFIGEGVFSGVDPSFRIKVLPALYNDYVNDANWSQYKDLIVASDYVPTNQDPIVMDGVTYGYAAQSLNTIPTAEVVRLTASYWNIPILIYEAFAAVDLIHSAYRWISGASKSATLSQALDEQVAAREWEVKECHGVALDDVQKYNLVWDKNLNTYTYWDNPAEVAGEEALGGADEFVFSEDFNDSYFQRLEPRPFKQLTTIQTRLQEAIEAFSANQNELKALSQGIKGNMLQSMGINYLINRAKKDFLRNPTLYINGANWVKTETRTNSPLVYVKSVDNSLKSVTIYSDPGSQGFFSLTADHYRTTCIGSEAFRGNTTVEEVKFQDNKKSLDPLHPMVLVLPDSCFAGCTNLKTLDLVFNSKFRERKKSLTPDNFILTGDIFAGCDTSKIKILIGEDVIDDFRDDEYWVRYSSMFKTVSAEEEADETDLGCKYTLYYDINTYPLQTTLSNSQDLHHVEVFGADDSYITEHNGYAALINDYGLLFNYKLDEVKAKAFKGNNNLKILDFIDSNSSCGDVYTDLSITLRDSAFANCKNFRDLNLIYQVTDGTNHTASISPEQINLGNGVFAGCDSLRIKFCLDQESLFKNNNSWNKYSRHFLPCFFEPVDGKVFNLLKDDCQFQSGSQSGSWKHIDATRTTPEKLRNKFSGTDIESFDEFKAFGTCGLRTVYNGMFKNCSSLQSIYLPDSIKTIESEAFRGCSSLSRIVIPSHVDSVGDSIFAGSGLTKIVWRNPKPIELNQLSVFGGLPDNYIIYVNDSVVDLFKEKWADVKDHINSINSYRGLTTVTLTKAGTLAEKLGLKYEYDNSATTRSSMTGCYGQYDSLRIVGYLNGKDIAVLRHLAGRKMNGDSVPGGNLRYLNIYECRIVKDDEAKYTTDPQAYWIGSNDYIEGYMFANLKLTTLILPKYTNKINHHAMSTCNRLTRLVVGDNTTEMDNDILENCSSMEEVVMLPNSSPELSSNVWRNAPRFSAFIFNNKESMANYTNNVLYYGQADTTYYNYVDAEVQRAMVKKDIFIRSEFQRLTDITGYVNNNTEIKIFNELMCTPIQTLGNRSLTGMTALEETALPLNLKTITADAFKGCTSLKTIWAYGEEVPSMAEDALVSLPTDFVIWVVAGDEKKYREAWPQYASHIKGYRKKTSPVVEITLDEPNTLANELGLTVTMGSGKYIKSIAGDMSSITALKVNGPIGSLDVAVLRMLGGCDFNRQPVYTTNLKYLDLYDATLQEDNSVYYLSYQNEELKGLYFWMNTYSLDNANEVPKYMFSQCDNLQTIILPRTATKICDDAFYNMYSLKTLVIGDNTDDVDGNDAFGECRKLSTMIFLSERKPALNHDAFTDPTLLSDNYKVANMYVRKSLLDQYTNDAQYTGHANYISTVFDEDDLFRAYGSKGLATEDDLANVDSISGMFRNFPGVTDLTTLSKTSVTKLYSDDLASLSNLKHISLPATLAEVEDNSFKANSQLRWADFSACDTLDANISNMGIAPEALVYTAKNMGTSNEDNVVYYNGDTLTCTQYNLSAERDYDVPKAFTAQSINFSRNFPKDSTYTLCLPFAAEVPQYSKAYLLKNSDYIELRFGQVEAIEAYKPYVLRTADTTAYLQFDGETRVEATPSRLPQMKTTGYTMTGTLSNISHATAVDSKMMVMGDSAVWNLVTADSVVNILPYTAYIQVNSTTAKTSGVPSIFEDIVYDSICLDEDANNSTLIAEYDSIKVNAHLQRTFVKDEWTTLCLPFSFRIVDSPLKKAQVIAVKEIEGNSYIYDDVDVVKAGESYIVRTADNITNPVFEAVRINNVKDIYNNGYDFVGTYDATPIDGSGTTYTINPNGTIKLLTIAESVKESKGFKSLSSNTAKGLRGYFKVPTATSEKPQIFLDGSIIGIDEVVTDTTDGPVTIYDTTGLYMGSDLKKLPKGIYIVNGKKVMK